MSDEITIHSERKNRTVICTVLFSDVVDFSQRPVGDQTSIKEHFNFVVGDALRNVAASDRMVLDTGDGVALCLFGDPEEGMFVALGLRDGFASERPLNVPDYLVRIGINLGPIKVVTDLNQQFNAIGDGINVAQRVMNFAAPGQVLCSRSYFEIVSRLSDDFSRLFEYCGVRHDKHVREHDVYEVRSPGTTGSSGFDMPEPAAVPVKTGCTLDADTFERIVTLLARYEGPLARVLVKRSCSTEMDAEAVVRKIASGMHDSKEAEEFVRLTKAVLGPK